MIWDTELGTPDSPAARTPHHEAMLAAREQGAPSSLGAAFMNDLETLKKTNVQLGLPTCPLLKVQSIVSLRLGRCSLILGTWHPHIYLWGSGRVARSRTQCCHQPSTTDWVGYCCVLNHRAAPCSTEH